VVAVAEQMIAANSTRARLEAQLRFERAGSPHGVFELAADFRLEPGITILFGPSGAGKSTLLDCIAGLLKPSSARIILNGEPLHDTATKTFLPPEARRLAYLFQEPALFPHLTVEQNVAFGLQHLAPPDRTNRAQDLLTAFRVERLATRKPAEISGGEAQRVALARALATSPRAVLLDEPLKGLDAELKSAIVDDLRAWNRARQLPVLYVTHQRDEVDALGERVIAMDRGHIVAEGAPHAVLDAPRKKRLAYAAGFENHLSAVVQDIREPDGVMRVRLAGSETELEVPLAYAAAGNRIHIAIRAGDILLAARKPEGLSARNVLEGTIASLEINGTTVVCRVNAGALFLVHVTPGAARSLELAAGQRVWLVIKTHSCHLVED
jgi:molybdate transport system ATP-binding protein